MKGNLKTKRTKLSKFVKKIEYFVRNKKVKEEYVVLGKVYNRKEYFNLLKNWEIENVI